MGDARDEAEASLRSQRQIAKVRDGRGKPRPHSSKVKSWRASQGLVSRARLVDAEGDLVGDADAVAFQGDDFFRVIGEDADFLES